MRLHKNIKIFFNYFFSPVLFIWLCGSIYYQLHTQPQLGASWAHIRQSALSGQWAWLTAVAGLMIVNWMLEAIKWQRAVQTVHPLTFGQSFKAVLSGVAFSVSTPNRIGEYVGRMLYMPEGKRLKVIAVTLLCSWSQLLVTLLMGGLSLLVLRPLLVQQWTFLAHTGRVLLLFGLGLGVLGFLYFKVGWIEKKLESVWGQSRFFYLVEAIRSFGMQRLAVLLLLSGARFAVFLVQYQLLFRVFGVGAPAGLLLWLTCLSFLLLAIIPSIALVEIGVRGEVGLQVFGIASANQLGIVLTSVSIWLINLILPALAGSLLILSIRVFRNRRSKKLNITETQ